MRLFPCAFRGVVGLFVEGVIVACFACSLWCTSALASLASLVGTQSPTAGDARGATGELVERPRLSTFVALETRPPAEEPQEPRSAPRLYTKYCAKCHKEDGTGSKNVSNEIPDFARPAWQRERSEVQLRISIRDGKGHAMPGFGDRFSDRELKDLAAHVRAFAPSNRLEGRTTQDAEFDARFHKLELELAELRREFWQLHKESKQKKPAAPAKDPDQ